MASKKFYTISTLVLATRKEAEEYLLKWDAEGDLRAKTVIIEVEKGKIFRPERSFKFKEEKHGQTK